MDSGRIFKINKAWVEYSWQYECIDNYAVIVKDTSFQTVIDGEFNRRYDTCKPWYSIELENSSSASYIGGTLNFNVNANDNVQTFIISKSAIGDFKNRVNITEVKLYKISN